MLSQQDAISGKYTHHCICNPNQGNFTTSRNISTGGRVYTNNRSNYQYRVSQQLYRTVSQVLIIKKHQYPLVERTSCKISHPDWRSAVKYYDMELSQNQSHDLSYLRCHAASSLPWTLPLLTFQWTPPELPWPARQSLYHALSNWATYSSWHRWPMQIQALAWMFFGILAQMILISVVHYCISEVFSCLGNCQKFAIIIIVLELVDPR